MSDMPRTDGNAGIVTNAIGEQLEAVPASLARELEIELWKCKEAHMSNCLDADKLRATIAELRETQPEGAARLALLGIERMIESVNEDLRNQDPGNHATIGALKGEGQGLIAAKMLLEGAMRGHHGDHVRRPQLPAEGQK